MNQVQLFQEKLAYYNKPFITKEFLQQLFDRFAPKYTIAEASKRNLISPIKKDSLYINLSYKKFIHPLVFGAVYCDQHIYMYGGLDIYNQYGFTTQIAEWYTIYTTMFQGKKIFPQAKIIFKKVRKNFFYGMTAKIIDGYTISMLTPERALIQLLIEKKGNIEFVDDIYTLIEQGIVNKEKIIALAKDYSSKNTQVLISRFLAGMQS